MAAGELRRYLIKSILSAGSKLRRNVLLRQRLHNSLCNGHCPHLKLQPRAAVLAAAFRLRTVSGPTADSGRTDQHIFDLDFLVSILSIFQCQQRRRHLGVLMVSVGKEYPQGLAPSLRSPLEIIMKIGMRRPPPPLVTPSLAFGPTVRHARFFFSLLFLLGLIFFFPSKQTDGQEEVRT